MLHTSLQAFVKGTSHKWMKHVDVKQLGHVEQNKHLNGDGLSVQFLPSSRRQEACSTEELNGFKSLDFSKDISSSVNTGFGLGYY